MQLQDEQVMDNIRIRQSTPLQKIIEENKITNNDEDDLDNVLDKIFRFYEGFLDDASTYEDHSDLIFSNVPPSSSSSRSTAVLLSEPSTNLIPIVNNNNIFQDSFSFDNKPISSNNDVVSNKRQKLDVDSTHSVVSENSTSSNEQNLSFPKVNMKNNPRLSYIMKVPRLISQAINSMNQMQLKEIIENACLPDCKLRTSALPDDLPGREHIIEFYKGINRMFPDYIMNILPPTINHRVITTKVFAAGTSCKKDDPSDYLFNHLKYNKDTELKDSKAKYMSLIEEGKSFSFKAKSVMHLILNEEFTHVEMFFYDSKVFDVLETAFAVS